jgi:short-subunit dehydrogenase involved in D-alanine esterification of teichoic acids
MNLRTQLSKDEKGRNIRVVEIAPPTLATNLHRERSDPDDNTKEKNPDALSLEEFMEFVRKGLEGDKEMIGAGMSERVVEKWYGAFGESYEEAAAK